MSDTSPSQSKSPKIVVAAVMLFIAGSVAVAAYAGVRWYNRPAEWTDNYADAVKQAQAEHKEVLLYFTGSDWCVNCFRLDDEVFTKPAFNRYARQHYVLVELDFPLHKNLPDAVIQQNNSLRDKYQPGDYLPVALLVDAEGKKIGEVVGYDGSGVDGYLGQLDPAYPVHPVTAPANKAPTATSAN